MTRWLRSDALIACTLAIVMGVVWTMRDWTNLGQLRLPDTDDVMRLAQVRDWLAGQGAFDLSQHRLAGGLPMHWTRVADIGPAAIILACRPWMGVHAAEVAAVTIWPIVLFAGALTIMARIARHLGGAGIAPTAALVAALAYPATTIFVPGRIDHHGLQILLLLATVAGLLDRRRRGAAAAGVCAGLSLIVGLETAPLLALCGAWVVANWAEGMRQDDGPLGAFAIAAMMTLLVGRILFAADAFAYPACDGFTRIAWQAELVLFAVPALLATFGSQLSDRRMRWIAALALSSLGLAVALSISPQCRAPYGAIDPQIARLWLANVGEAQSIRAAPMAITFGYCGLAVAGLLATLWQFHRCRSRRRDWGLIALLLAGALAVSAAQLRGAYPAALLAAPGLAALIAAARARGAPLVIASWLASAGILYPLAAGAPPITPARAAPGRGDCTSPAMIAALSRLPRGLVIAPIDAGAWIIGGTGHAVLAAPYHRDGAGMAAVYRFYAAPSARAAGDADRLGARYVLSCAAMPGVERRGSTAAALVRDVPAGFSIAADLRDGARILSRNRLSGGASPA